LVTGWRQSVVKEGVLRCFGHWFDTVDRQRKSFEKDVRERCFVTGWTHQIVREGHGDV